MQKGTRVSGQRLARHAHNRGRGSVNLKATNVAAPALNAAERFYAGVTKFASRTVNAAPKLSVKNDRAAHTGTEGQADNGFAVARRALPHLAQCRGIRIILKEHWPVERFSQRRRQTKAGQGRDVRSVNDNSGSDLNRSGNDNGNYLHLRASLQTFRLTFADG